ncbi:cyclin-dependent kinase 2-interacting protein-like [Bacillus rossius redtenbacheri]|uniref:cyclin-dependent kinase 2-interacting protein-like n=1 Tax=Bacillus rossius redtenbacheri TaxID=93214 RepID=UPI002FDE0D36
MCNVTPPSHSNRKSFSPIIVRESPVKRIAQSGNLTGEPRRVRDLAAELHALAQKWSLLHLEGLQLLTAMVPAVHRRREEGIESSVLQDQCNQLCEIHKSMSDVVAIMDTIAKQYRGLEVLRKTDDQPMFLTWPPSKFSEVSSRLSQAYRAELEAKRRVVENVAHGRDEATATYYMALWMHQVYIDTDAELGLESMLLETGLREVACASSR